MGTIGLPSTIPNNYVGPPVNLVPLRRFPHQPTNIDKKYPVGQFVILGENPSTGSAGELWYLSRFSSGLPVWEQISIAAGSPGIDTITTDDGAPAVEPDVNGNVNVTGDGTFIETTGQGPGSTVVIQPISPYIINVNVDANTGPGTDPVPPDASGVITVTGGQVAAGTTVNAIRTASLAPNTYTIQAQISSAQSSSTIGSNGISHYSNLDFSVDSNGFVQLNPSFPAFSAGVSSPILDVTGDGTSYTIIFDSEVFDLGNNYNPATGVFTAPVAGIYQFSTYVSLLQIDAAMTRGVILINSSPVTDNDFGATRNVANTVGYNGSVILSLAASATVRVSVQVDNSTKTADINNNSFFCGALLRRT